MGNKTAKLDELSAEGVAKMQAETGLHNVNAKTLFEVFKAKEKGGKITKEAFADGIKALEAHKMKPVKPEFVAKLYEQLDSTRDGNVDFLECISGLVLLTGGSVDDKIEVYFKLYDQDNSGGISKDELYKMVKLAWGNAFRSLAAAHADKANLAMDLLDHMVDDLAKDFSGQVFQLLDSNKDGVLSLDEFKKFASGEPKVKAELNGWTKEVSLVNV